MRGYFVWSLLDSFEWSRGYGASFGSLRVDYETSEWIPKHVARWCSNVISPNEIGISLMVRCV